MATISIKREVIGVRCSKCGACGLLDQKPGHGCAEIGCGGNLAEYRHDSTNCQWCSESGICLVCAKEVRRLIRQKGSA